MACRAAEEGGHIQPSQLVRKQKGELSHFIPEKDHGPYSQKALTLELFLSANSSQLSCWTYIISEGARPIANSTYEREALRIRPRKHRKDAAAAYSH